MGLTPFRSLSPASLASVKHAVFFSVATENDIINTLQRNNKFNACYFRDSR